MILEKIYGAAQRRMPRKSNASKHKTPPEVESAVHASFSQCGEDMILRFLFGALGLSGGVYVDIGANHPTNINNTFYFYKSGWRGTNIDPLEKNILLFNAMRPRDNNVACGVGKIGGMKKFYHMDADTLSTFDYETAMSYVDKGHRVKEVSDVRMMTILELVSSGDIPESIDLLSIDIEGNELDVVSQFIERDIRPKVIVCETAFYEKNIRDMKKNLPLIRGIRNFDYKVYADTRVNTIFIDGKQIQMSEDICAL